MCRSEIFLVGGESLWMVSEMLMDVCEIFLGRFLWMICL